MNKEISSWTIVETIQESGAIAHSVVGYSGEARVEFECVDKSSAEWLAGCLDDRSAVDRATASALQP